LEGIYEELRRRTGGTFEVRAYPTSVLQARKAVPGLPRPTHAPATAVGYVMYLPGLARGVSAMHAECVVVAPGDGMVALTWLLQHALLTAHQWELKRVGRGVTTVLSPTKLPAA
jgi:hypothetical protein